MISISTNQRSVSARIKLPSSKSESNRALIIQALSKEPIELTNLSSARDTQTMMRLLEYEGQVLDVIDAGTVMRFLTAYCAAVGRDQILTGTPRMCKRPIGILVDALRELGAQIDYWKQEGFPPLHLVSKGSQMHGGKVELAGNVSSQFISALMLIGSTLEGGVTIELTGPIYSRPYINMTMQIINYFGVNCRWEGERTIIVPEEPYKQSSYKIESDWSAASYWYSIMALAHEGEIFLEGLREKSWQGDSEIANVMTQFGVKSEFSEDGVKLTKTAVPRTDKPVLIDFRAIPDLAQTMAVVSAGTGIPLELTGIESLRIKETDRIAALQNELGKFGVTMEEVREGVFAIAGSYQPSQSIIETYEDHRMAMAFAPLVFMQPTMNLKDHEVVQKSYPEFWDHLELAGVQVSYW